VYQKEVEGIAPRIAVGDRVRLQDRKGQTLGMGIWCDGKISVRVFQWGDAPFDDALIEARMETAWTRRRMPEDVTAWRWVHGENDELSGVRIDVWGRHVTLSLSTIALRTLVPVITKVIRDKIDADAIWLAWRLGDEESESEVQTEVAWIAPHLDATDFGSSTEPVEVQEHGMKMGVRPWAGADTGMFCDMRGVRRWLMPHWKGKRVLNTFAHTGAYSVAAALGGAQQVTTVDLSARYVDWSKENFQRNELDVEDHNFVVADTFDALDGFRRKGERFDVIIVDPPSFSHSKSGRWSVAKGLGRLVSGALRTLEPNGWLVVASNHGALAPRDFQKQIIDGAKKAGRPLRLVHVGSPPLDFPAALNFPESRYLKVWVLQG